MMKVVVSGAGGYLGSSLCVALRDRADVVALGHRGGDLRTPFIEADITDESAVASALAGADIVYHLAAVAGEDRCLADPVAASRANLVGTATIVRAAREAGVSRVVFASSYWVYSVRAERPMPIKEGDALMTDTFYGAMKVAGEAMVASLVDSVSLRFSNVYGYGTGTGALWNGFVGRCVRAASEGEPMTLYGTGAQGLELLHVDDAMRALIRAGEIERLPHRVYNVGVGRLITVREIAEMVADVVAGRGAPRPTIRRVTAPEGKVWPDRWLDVSRVKEDLAIAPLVSLRQGLSELVERYGGRDA